MGLGLVSGLGFRVGLGFRGLRLLKYGPLGLCRAYARFTHLRAHMAQPSTLKPVGLQPSGFRI